MSVPVVDRLAAALERPVDGPLPLLLVINAGEARELLRLARLADPWHQCTPDGPKPPPTPERRPLDLPDEPPFT